MLEEILGWSMDSMKEYDVLDDQPIDTLYHIYRSGYTL